MVDSVRLKALHIKVFQTQKVPCIMVGQMKIIIITHVEQINKKRIRSRKATAEYTKSQVYA